MDEKELGGACRDRKKTLKKEYMLLSPYGNRFPRDDNKLRPQLGEAITRKGPRETAETWHTGPQPSRYVRRKGAAPLSGAEEHTARAVSVSAQYAGLLSL